MCLGDEHADDGGLHEGRDGDGLRLHARAQLPQGRQRLPGIYLSIHLSIYPLAYYVI